MNLKRCGNTIYHLPDEPDSDIPFLVVSYPTHTTPECYVVGICRMRYRSLTIIHQQERRAIRVQIRQPPVYCANHRLSGSDEHHEMR